MVAVFDLCFLLICAKQGVQTLLDGVLNYLPCPVEVSNYALDQTKDEEKVSIIFLVEFLPFPLLHVQMQSLKFCAHLLLGYLNWKPYWPSGCLGI